MRGLVPLLLVLALAAPASAGLYNTSEPEEGRRSDNSIHPRDWFVQVFRDTLLQLRSIGLSKVPVEKPLRKRYVLEADLAARFNPSGLSPEQKLNLSAVFIRRKRYDDAISLLTPYTRQQPKHFLAQSNLATAYQLAGQDSRAIDTLEQALSVWPAEMGKVEETYRKFLESVGFAYDFYRRVETYQLKLLKVRSREALTKKGRSGFETVDAIFDDGKSPPRPLRFVGESGKFEPGKLAPQEKEKLPKDAIDIVQQLLIWLPEDLRLYWLLGELYNAQGGTDNIRSARVIFDDLAGWEGQNVRPEELLEHRKAIIAYEAAVQSEPTSAETDIEKRLDDAEKKRQDQPPRIDWQTLGVGFGVGLVVAVFGMWQIREIRRRLKKV